MCRILNLWYHANVQWFKLIKFTDKLNYVTIFFQDEIYVKQVMSILETWLFLNTFIFYVFHHNLFYYNFTYCISLSHDASHIFSKLRNCCLAVLTGYIFSIFGFLFWNMNMFWIQMNEFFLTTFCQALTFCQL